MDQFILRIKFWKNPGNIEQTTAPDESIFVTQENGD